MTLVHGDGSEVRVAAGALGVYHASGLEAGAWEMPVASPGFTLARDEAFVLFDGATVQRDVRLALAGVREELTVSEEPTPGYAILNAAAGYRRGHVAVTVGATNLFDKLYSPHLSYQRDPFRSGVRVYDPGRNVYVNLSSRL